MLKKALLTRQSIWIAIGIAYLAVAGCESKKPANEAPAQSAASSTASSTIPSPDTSAKSTEPGEGSAELSSSDVITVQAGDIGQALRANGTLRAIQQSSVRAKVSGEIIEVNVREGQKVSAGEVLARIDDSEYVARVKDRKAALEAGRAQATFAESTRSKSEELLQKKFISSQAYDNTKSAASVASSQVQSLEAQLTLAEKALNDTVVRAPISGWLSERAVQRGDKASVDGKLFTIVDLSRLELEALVPANEVARVAVGQVFTTSVEGFADKHFIGRVARIGAQAASGSRTVTIYIEIANPDAALKAGLFAEGTLSLGRSKARALVPITALHSEAGVNYVYAIDANRIKRIAVEVGTRSEGDGVVDILKGLDAGMRVVAVDLGPLRDGANATVSTAPAKAR